MDHKRTTPNATDQSRASWSVREVARRHGVSEQFIRLEILRGRLQARKVARRVLIPVGAEEEWLQGAPQATGRRSA